MIVGRQIIHLAQTTSTMDEIERLARSGEMEGLVVVADFQSLGRGRSGREWVARPGLALLCSILLRPEVPANMVAALPLHLGVAVAQAIEEASGTSCKLKWPNDLLVRGKKVAGILTTSRLKGNAIDHVTVGIGINLGPSLEDLPSSATSVSIEAGEQVARQTMLDALLPRLDRRYRAFIAASGQLDLSDWSDRAAFLGERVVVEDADRKVQGRYVGIDQQGGLKLEMDDLSTRVFVVGELTRGPRLPE